MIESCRWTNVNGMVVDFNTDDIPFTSFTTECDLRFSEKSRSQRHGIYPADTYLGKRIFHVEGDLFGDTSATYWQRRLNMVGALMPKPQYNRKIVGTLELELTGINEKLTCECTVEGYPELPLNASSPARSKFMVSWKSFDPRLYGPVQSTDIPYSPQWENIGGRAYDKTFDKTYATTAIGPGQVYVTNSGNTEMFPIIVFYGPVTTPRAVMARDDGAVYVFELTGVTLGDVTDYVIVDMEAHTVTRGNGQNMYNFARGSDWFSLEPAPVTNTITYFASSIAVPSHMSVQWKNGYMI